jgi:ATP-dependent Zn protease
MTTRATTYHESGHSVVGVQFALNVRRVVVHPQRRPDGEAGFCELVNVADAIDADAFRSIVYVMAGPQAERRFTGRSDTGDLRDREQAAAIARIIHEHKPADHPDISGTVARAEVIARALMLNPATWAAVEAVAKELERKRSLSGRDVALIVRKVWR